MWTEDIGRFLIDSIEISVGGGPGYWCQKCYKNHPSKRKVCKAEIKEFNWELVREKFKAEFNPYEDDLNSHSGCDFATTEEEKLDNCIRENFFWLEEQGADDSNWLFSICNGKVKKEDRAGHVIDKSYPELDRALEELNELKAIQEEKKMTTRQKAKIQRKRSKQKAKRKSKRLQGFIDAEHNENIINGFVAEHNENISTVMDASTTTASITSPKTNGTQES